MKVVGRLNSSGAARTQCLPLLILLAILPLPSRGITYVVNATLCGGGNSCNNCRDRGCTFYE
jgi:hypothetical protein